MTTEYYLKLMIGALFLQVAQLQAELDTLKAKLAEKG